MNYILLIAIFFFIANCQIQDIQKSKLQFFKIQYQTYGILARSFPNLLIWVSDEENSAHYNQTMDILNNALNIYYQNEIYMKDNLLFVQGVFENFYAQNPTQFPQPGLYIKRMETILNYDLDLTEENLKELLADINTLLMKEVSLEEYSESLNDIQQNTIALIVSSQDEKYVFLRNLCEEIISNDKYDIQKGLWLNLTKYEDQKTPILKIHLPTRPNILYEGITNAEDFKRYIIFQVAPTLIKLEESKFPLIFNSMIKTSVHLLIENEEEDSLLLSQLESVAFENKITQGQQNFFFTYSTYDENKDFWKEFKFFNTTSKPKLVITEIRDGSYFLHKYIYTGDEILDQQTIKNFLIQFKDGNLEPFLISEEIKNQIISEGNFIQLNQKYFESQTKQLCLILAYQSSHEEIFQKSKQFAMNVLKGEPISLFQIDILKNEIPELSIKRAPTFVIFQNNKQLSVYDGKLDEKDFLQWLKKYQIKQKEDL